MSTKDANFCVKNQFLIEMECTKGIRDENICVGRALVLLLFVQLGLLPDLAMFDYM